MPTIRLSGTFISCAMLVTIAAGIPVDSRAQSSPVDLADMSLVELMDVEVVRGGESGENAPAARRWHVGYRYLRSVFDGYRDGTDRISDSSLIGPPNGTTYPILQQKIVQEAHTFEMAYDFARWGTVSFVAPYIRQSTDHTSIVPAFSNFTIRSDGIGDVSLMGSILVFQRELHAVRVGAGVSFPTGSIREKGHTPAGPGSQLPYTMQLGSGTWDVPMSVSYAGRTESAIPWIGPVSWGTQLLGKVRTGQNSRGYRLGDRVVIQGWLRARPVAWFEPSIKLDTQIWGKIRGHDQNFPGPIYPTPVADPSNFGGTKLSVVLGAKFRVPEIGESVVYRIISAQSFGIDVGRPVYQSLNGPQPEEEWRINVAWNVGF